MDSSLTRLFEKPDNREAEFQNREPLNSMQASRPSSHCGGAAVALVTLLLLSALVAVSASGTRSLAPRASPIAQVGRQDGQAGATSKSLAESAGVPALGWSKLAPATFPPGRFGASMVYDAADGYIVLVGGCNASAGMCEQLQSGTWEFRDGSWSQLTGLTTAPSPRAFAAITYDVGDGYVLLYGGCSVGPSRFQPGTCVAWDNDTWAFRAGIWWRVNTTTGPANVTAGASMAYDSQSHEVVLFGGGAPDGEFYGLAPENQTWGFRTGGWTLLSTAAAPGPRIFASMAEDPATGRLVLFGGQAESAPCPTCAETWTFTAGNWAPEPATGAQPPEDWLMAMADDPGANATFLFDGNHAGAVNSWFFQNNSWAPASTTGASAQLGGPGLRWGESVAFDPASSSVILFGGVNASYSLHCCNTSSETWAFGPIPANGSRGTSAPPSVADLRTFVGVGVGVAAGAAVIAIAIVQTGKRREPPYSPL